MTDGSQNITSVATTTTTTTTFLHQGQTSQSSQQHTMVAAAPAPSAGIHFLPVPSQRQLSPPYETHQPYPMPCYLPYPGYFHASPYDLTGMHPLPSTTESSHTSPSSLGGPGLSAQPPGSSIMPGFSYMPSGEQLLRPPSSFVYDPHHAVAIPPPWQEASPQQMLPSFPADVQYPRSALEQPSVISDRVPVYSSHLTQPVHRMGHPEHQQEIQEPHSQKSFVFHEQEKPYTQTLPALQYTTHHQQRAHDIRSLEQELARLSQTQQRIAAKMQQLEQEKNQLAYEQQLEQEQLYRQQQRLSQESFWLEQQRMRFMHSAHVSNISGYGVSHPTAQFSGQNIIFPPPNPQASFIPPAAPTIMMTPQSIEITPSRVSELRHPSYPHPMAEASHSKLPLAPASAAGFYAHHMEVATDSQELTKDDTRPTTALEPCSATATAGSAYQFKPDVETFRPHGIPRWPQRRPHQHSSKYQFQHQHHQLGTGHEIRSSPAANLLLQDVLKKLRNYALEVMVPSSDVDEQGKLEGVKGTVMRVPAVCFNEQKFLDREDYKVLVQPQSPAIRGQEALARVCFVLEQALHLRGMGATIISDYKFKENYLKRAPQEVLNVLYRPEDEGSHNVLMIGPQIGIVCIQVTCVEESTNSSTVKKQVRDTLRQLKKDEKVLRHVLQDLDLGADCIRQVMALPNVTTHQLKQKLETKYVKILSAALSTTDDLEDLLTLDHLPGVGHRHWLSRESRDQLWAWLDRLAGLSGQLSLENYLQIFARYTCGWSVPEVWSVSKPRVLVRSWAHAVAETYRRYHLPVLTPQQDSLLHAGHPHVRIEAFAGTGHTCLLKAKAIMELRQGHTVLVFVPKDFISLRKDYEHLAISNEQYQESMYFWTDETRTARTSHCSFQTVGGTSKTLDDLTRNHHETIALFEHTNHDNNLLRLFAEVKDKVTSVWLMLDAAAKTMDELLPKDDAYFCVRFGTVTRLPSTIQVLVNQPSLEGATAKTLRPRTSAHDQQSVSLTTMSGPEGSSYQGLPTDGPFPLFIWHPVTAPGATQSAILNCQLCTNRLRSAMQSLVSEFLPRTHPDTGAETLSAAQRQTQMPDSPAAEHSESREVVRGATDAAEEDSDAKSGEPNIHVNSGNVPPPLTMDDVVLFVDSREHVHVLKEVLGLVNAESIIHPLEDLPFLMGSEKAIVGFVGSVNMQVTDTVLQALVSKLCGIMTLCQGQLILAVELNYDLTGADSTVDRQQWEPFELDIDEMLQQSQREHNL